MQQYVYGWGARCSRDTQHRISVFQLVTNWKYHPPFEHVPAPCRWILGQGGSR